MTAAILPFCSRHSQLPATVQPIIAARSRQSRRKHHAISVCAQNSSSRSAGVTRGGTRPRCSRSHMRRLFSAQPLPVSATCPAHNSLPPRGISSPQTAQSFIVSTCAIDYTHGKATATCRRWLCPLSTTTALPPLSRGLAPAPHITEPRQQAERSWPLRRWPPRRARSAAEVISTLIWPSGSTGILMRPPRPRRRSVDSLRTCSPRFHRNRAPNDRRQHGRRRITRDSS